jgi:hypothetical protein
MEKKGRVWEKKKRERELQRRWREERERRERKRVGLMNKEDKRSFSVNRVITLPFWVKTHTVLKRITTLRYPYSVSF